MTDKRSHSRSAAGSRKGAEDGAHSVQAPSLSDASREAFARGGQFTGRKPEPGAGEPAPAEGGVPPAGSSTPPAGGAPSAGGVPPASGVAVSAEQYEQLMSERDEYRSDLQRLAAEFDNFRKRSIREREMAAASADVKLLCDLLAVLDDFERALEQGAGDESPLAQGIAMVHARLDATLKQQGLTEVDAAGTFDPQRHEAVLMQATPGVEDGTITHVAQKGYCIGDRVIRHAKVVVAGES